MFSGFLSVLGGFLWVLGRIFRFSGVFCVDCALFRPKRAPAVRFCAQTKLKKKWKPRVGEPRDPAAPPDPPLSDLPEGFYEIPARLRQVFKFFLNFCFGPLPDPFGSFGTKKSAIDAENAKESENRANPHKKKHVCFCGFWPERAVDKFSTFS